MNERETQKIDAMSNDDAHQSLAAALERMRAKADNAYCDYIHQLRRDECLGWEIKVERGNFGEAELKAHCAAAEKLGRHRAMHEAANMLADVLKSNAEPTCSHCSGTGRMVRDQDIGTDQECFVCEGRGTVPKNAN